MKINKLFLFFILFYACSSSADKCSDVPCPQGRQPIDICYVDPASYQGLFGPFYNAEDWFLCLGSYRREKVENTSQLENKLNDLVNKCKSINKMTLLGHGGEGFSSAGKLDVASVQSLSKFSCLFNENAKIKFVACKVGKKCIGDMLLYQTAKALLGKGGTVSAPVTDSITFLPDSKRILTYNPQSNTPDLWSGERGTINDRCAEELSDLLANLESEKSNAQKRNCSPGGSVIDNDSLASYERLKSRLSSLPPYFQSASSHEWNKFPFILDDLKYDILRYKTCERLPSFSSGVPSLR